MCLYKKVDKKQLNPTSVHCNESVLWDKKGEHITDIYITETDTTEHENLSHYIIDIFIIET